MIGYLTLWDGLIVVDHSSQKALNIARTGEVTQLRMYALDNGSKVDYDGVANAAIIPGQVTQNFKVVPPAVGYDIFEQFENRRGHLGTATFSPFIAGPTQQASARLADVVDISKLSITTRSVMSVSLVFEITSTWT